MKNLSFLKLSNSFFLIFAICSFFFTNTVEAQRVNCNKICYEFAGPQVGGPICTGAPGAVPPNSRVVVTDNRGNRATGQSRADGSFGISAANLTARVGAMVVVQVNGQRCRVRVQPQGACNNQAGGNQGGNGNPGGGNNQGNVPNQGGNNNQNGGNNPQAVDCSKICYEFAGPQVGGPICTGAPGAVPPNSQVVITDNRGKRATGQSRADGSFGFSTSNLNARVGQFVIVRVNGKQCRVRVQPQGACNNQGGGNQGGNGNPGGGNNQGNVPNQGGNNNPNGGGNPNGANPCNPQKIGQIEGLQAEIVQMRKDAIEIICGGNTQEGKQMLDMADQLDRQLDALLQELVNVLQQGGGNNNPGNAPAPDCTKICYERGSVATGGPLCRGGAGAVAPNSQVRIIDPQGRVSTVQSGADGSFVAPCGNHNVQVGDTITIQVNGKTCTVKVQQRC